MNLFKVGLGCFCECAYFSIIFFHLPLATCVWGWPPEGLSSINFEHHTLDYLFDNEFYPGDAEPLLRGHQGVYVAVGAERGFMGAALANSSGLLLVDHGGNVVFYNRINIALLKIAEDQNDYRKLRLEQPISEIRKRAANSSLSNDTKELFSSPFFEAYWFKRVRQNRMLLSYLQTPPNERQLYTVTDFPCAPGNYLFEKELFERVSSLAKRDRIVSVQAKLSDEETSQAISHFLTQCQSPLGVLDVSNIRTNGLMGGEEEIRSLLANVAKFGRAADQAILLTTEPIAAKSEKPGRFSNIEHWQYEVSPIGDLSSTTIPRPSDCKNQFRKLN